jgi:hypothetical protein
MTSSSIGSDGRHSTRARDASVDVEQSAAARGLERRSQRFLAHVPGEVDERPTVRAT